MEHYATNKNVQMIAIKMEIVSKVFAAATVIGNDMIAVLDHAKKIVHFKAIAIMELACATKDLLDNYANLNVVQTDVQEMVYVNLMVHVYVMLVGKVKIVHIRLVNMIVLIKEHVIMVNAYVPLRLQDNIVSQ